MDEPWIGILETTSVNKLYTLFETIIRDTAIIYALTNSCQSSNTIILNDDIVNISASVTVISNAIIAQPDIMTILTQSFYLIVYLLGNTTMF